MSNGQRQTANVEGEKDSRSSAIRHSEFDIRHSEVAAGQSGAFPIIRGERDREPAAAMIVFAGGGSGGHLYPALAVAKALRAEVSTARFVFFGTDRPIDGRILAEAGYELVEQTLPPLRRAPWSWPSTLLGLRRCGALCRARFDRDLPMVVIGTGGLASIAAVRQAQRARIPTVLLNPDAVPGRANRLLARRANRVCVQWEETVALLPARAKVRVTGCAGRPEFNAAKREAGIARFGLDPDRKTLLVTGASQGARTINEAAIANIDLLKSLAGWQVLHLTGQSDYQRVCQAYKDRSACARVLSFTEHMADALAAADLVIARAGASTLAEITAVGRPAVLMPYPHHRDMHQLANARCLARTSAARILPDAIDPAVNGPALRQVLAPLMRADEGRREMAAAAVRMGRGHAAATIAREVLEVIGWYGPGEGLETVEQRR